MAADDPVEPLLAGLVARNDGDRKYKRVITMITLA